MAHHLKPLFWGEFAVIYSLSAIEWYLKFQTYSVIASSPFPYLLRLFAITKGIVARPITHYR